MFYGLNKFIKDLLPKRLFYRALLIVAVPVILLQLLVTIVFFDSLWIKTNKGMTRALVGEIDTFIVAFDNEDNDKDYLIDLFSIYSLVILSFLFGSNWLNLIIVQTKGNIKRFLFFVILSPIFLIICEIFFRLEIKFFVYAIFYFLVQLIDNKFITNFDYLKIRKNLTILVIISHIIILINIYSNGIWYIFQSIFF